MKKNMMKIAVLFLCTIVTIYSCTKEVTPSPAKPQDPTAALHDYNAAFIQSVNEGPHPRTVTGGGERAVMLGVCDAMGGFEGGSIGWRISNAVPIPQAKLALVGFGALWGAIATTWAAAGAPHMIAPSGNTPDNGQNPLFDVGALHNQHIYNLISNHYAFGTPSTDQYILTNGYPGLSPVETQQMFNEMQPDLTRMYNFYTTVEVYSDVQMYINALQTDPYSREFLLTTSQTVVSNPMTAQQIIDYTNGLENLVLQSGLDEERSYPLLAYVSVLRESTTMWISQNLPTAE
jgi:hypothetical protein